MELNFRACPVKELFSELEVKSAVLSYAQGMISLLNSVVAIYAIEHK